MTAYRDEKEDVLEKIDYVRKTLQTALRLFDTDSSISLTFLQDIESYIKERQGVEIDDLK